MVRTYLEVDGDDSSHLDGTTKRDLTIAFWRVVQYWNK